MANEVEIVVSSSQRGDAMAKTRRDFDQTGKAASRFGGILKGVGITAAGFLGAQLATAGLQKLTGYMSESIDLAKEQARVEGQLNAVIASTGGAAGISADQVKKMAAGFQEVTNFGDEAVISSSNVLLTFTKIGEETFPRAQEAVLDMSAALGTDLKGASIQVGKALNDPVKGAAALSEAGVQFTETQKEMIKTMVESGDTAGAQAIILAELETQFKGSAAAAVEADGGITQAENAMGDLQEQIGAKLIPVMARFKEIQLAVVTALVDRVIPAFARAIEVIRPFAEAVFGKLIELLPTVQRLFDETRAKIVTFIDGFKGIETTLNPESMIGKMNALGLKFREFMQIVVDDVIPAVVQAVGKLGEIWEEIGPDVMRILGQLGTFIVATLGLIIEVIRVFVATAQEIWARWGEEITLVARLAWELVSGVIGGALTIITGLINVFTAVLQGDWGAAWDGVVQILEGAWQIIQTVISVAWESIKATIGVALEAIKALIGAQLTTIWDTVTNIFTSIKNAIETQLNAAKVVVTAILGAIKGIFTSESEGAKTATIGKLQGIIDWVRGLPGKIAGLVVGMFSAIPNAFGGVITTLKNMWAGLSFAPKTASFNATATGATSRAAANAVRSVAGSGSSSSNSLRRRASGGLLTGLVEVGEYGTELVDLGAGGRVISNPDSQRMMSGGHAGGGGERLAVNDVYFNIAGSVLSERDLIAIIRDELNVGGLTGASV